MTPTFALLALLLGVQGGADLPVLLLPPGQDAWVVRIMTTGGFTGRGAGSVTASSAGDVLCTLVGGCPERLVPETNRTLSMLITGLGRVEASAGRPVTGGVCADCITTTMTVQRRDRQGEHTFDYTWDVTTVSTIPEDVVRLHGAITALTSTRSR